MIRRLSILALLLTASACLASTMKVEQTLSTSIGDLAAVKAIEVTTQSGEVLVRGTFNGEGGPSGTTGKIVRNAPLSSPTNGGSKGSVSIEIDRTSGLSEEEITVKLEALPYPESCKLMADGRELTLFSTTENGKLELKLARRVTLSNGKHY